MLAPGISDEMRTSRVKRVQEVLLDVLVCLPASSVEVERAHANTQIDINYNSKVAPRPLSVQANTYLASTYLSHKKIREHNSACSEGTSCGVWLPESQYALGQAQFRWHSERQAGVVERPLAARLGFQSWVMGRNNLDLDLELRI